MLKQYAPVLYHLINWYSSEFSLSKISRYIYSIIDINIRETFLPRKFPTTRYHLIDIRKSFLPQKFSTILYHLIILLLLILIFVKVFSLESFPLYSIS